MEGSVDLIKPKIKLHFHASGKTNRLLGQLDTSVGCCAPFGMPSNGSSNEIHLKSLSTGHIPLPVSLALLISVVCMCALRQCGTRLMIHDLQTLLHVCEHKQTEAAAEVDIIGEQQLKHAIGKTSTEVDIIEVQQLKQMQSGTIREQQLNEADAIGEQQPEWKR